MAPIRKDTSKLHKSQMAASSRHNTSVSHGIRIHLLRIPDLNILLLMLRVWSNQMPMFNQILMFLPLRVKNHTFGGIGSGEIIAEGYFVSSDPKDEVHHIPLGPSVMKVGIDLVRNNDASLWRPSGVMSTIEDAIGSIIVWPASRVIIS